MRRSLSFGRGSPAAEPADRARPVGGAPDLPLDALWPAGASGEPPPFVLQLNLTDLAGRFGGWLPWPAGGGIVQLFTVGDDRDVTVLVHRDLAALRRATPPVAPAHEYRLDPVPQRVLSDDPGDTAPMWALLDQLGGENPDLGELLDSWWRRFPASPIQVGGGGRWIQDTGYTQAWATDHGQTPYDFEFVDQDDYNRKAQAWHDNASERARAEGWQVVCSLTDDSRVTEAFASFGGFFFLAPADAAGRWDLDRLQVQFQSS